jgi:hypothetical protein
VLFFGSAYWEKASLALVFDSVVVLLYIAYLLGVRRTQRAS